MVRSASSRSFCPFQRRTLMHGDVVGLVALDFILWLILAAVAAARHRRVVQRALPKGAPHVGTGVIEGVQMSAHTRHVHLGSRDVENTHLPGDDILRLTKSY